MKKRLYKHQRSALGYSLQVRNPALFMQMRLGKTLVVIRRVALYKQKDTKVLVIAPVSALGGWCDELTSEGESFVVLDGTKEKRLNALHESSKVKWFLINKEGILTIKQLAALPWTAVVFDESHWIKNPKANITKYMTKYFRRVKHRWILTGTPNPENELEFACQMIFLNGEFCGCRSYWDFRAKYFEPSTWGYDWKPKKGTKALIEKELAKKAFVLSRKDAGMERTKIRETRYLKFTPEVRSMYDEIEKEFALEVREDMSTIWATEKYIWLRRLCGGWLNTDDFVWDGKVSELVTLLSYQLKNEKVVVWFDFNLEMKATLKYINNKRKNWQVAMITGETPNSIRESTRKRFNNEDLNILLVQQRVAQTGMDLSGADTAIYYSEPPGLTARQQTEDRILSLQKDGPLLYINLVVEDTVDVDIRHTNVAKAMKSKMMLSKILKSKMIERRCK